MASTFMNKKEVLKLIKAFGKAKAAGDEVLANKLYNEIARYMYD